MASVMSLQENFILPYHQHSRRHQLWGAILQDPYHNLLSSLGWLLV